MTSLLLGAILTADPLPILFFGNSHTAGNDLSGMVRQLLESDGSGRKIKVDFRMSGFLEEAASIQDNLNAIKSRKWFAIVMQGLKMSSSHKYEYDHTGAVNLAKFSKKHTEKPLFFAEWPRKDWDEADWILGQYGPISKETGVPIAPVGLAWKPVLKEFPKLSLWTADGNHATSAGSFLAACGIYYSLVGSEREPTWFPAGMDKKLASRLKAHAQSAVNKDSRN